MLKKFHSYQNVEIIHTFMYIEMDKFRYSHTMNLAIRKHQLQLPATAYMTLNTSREQKKQDTKKGHLGWFCFYETDQQAKLTRNSWPWLPLGTDGDQKWGDGGAPGKLMSASWSECLSSVCIRCVNIPQFVYILCMYFSVCYTPTLCLKKKIGLHLHVSASRKITKHFNIRTP